MSGSLFLVLLASEPEVTERETALLAGRAHPVLGGHAVAFEAVAERLAPRLGLAARLFRVYPRREEAAGHPGRAHPRDFARPRQDALIQVRDKRQQARSLEQRAGRYPVDARLPQRGVRHAPHTPAVEAGELGEA